MGSRRFSEAEREIVRMRAAQGVCDDAIAAELGRAHRGSVGRLRRDLGLAAARDVRAALMDAALRRGAAEGLKAAEVGALIGREPGAVYRRRWYARAREGRG